MRDRASGALLWLRALLTGSLMVLLGVVGHMSAGGEPPPPWALVALCVAAVVLTAPSLTRRVSTLRCMALLVAGQTVTHLSLEVLAASGRRGSAPSGRLHLHEGALPHVHGAVVDAGTGAPSLGTELIGHLTMHGSMALAHLVAALGVGLWLAVGERTLWTLLALAARRVLHLLRPTAASATTGPSARPPVPGSLLRPCAPRWRTAPRRRRGPPLLLG
ncbi:hypothetical protein [Nocardioides acrostichi]|uniref:Uncharacterized protein n=1 Tax=Nocardioides acrostichi TaxID=2784339 RepID=A0A930UZT6_9ACTN|nr:hypothetical protein [Nocardioides acrostichi]MBF4161414.1 hypothetical protein [Nocardioides acrostichi]